MAQEKHENCLQRLMGHHHRPKDEQDHMKNDESKNQGESDHGESGQVGDYRKKEENKFKPYMKEDKELEEPGRTYDGLM